ncbi:hypothetical protein A2U01_0040191, partial [Trifolium medium]|nr:hypothetical protein [Trifolium medium]
DDQRRIWVWKWCGFGSVLATIVSLAVVVGGSGGGHGIWVLEVMMWWLMPCVIGFL